MQSPVSLCILFLLDAFCCIGDAYIVVPHTHFTIYVGINDQGEQGRLPASATDTPTPTPINSTVQFASVSNGENHACALALSGQVFCWGQNNYGQVCQACVNGTLHFLMP